MNFYATVNIRKGNVSLKLFFYSLPETYKKIDLLLYSIWTPVVEYISCEAILSIVGTVSALFFFLLGHFVSWTLCWHLVTDLLLIFCVLLLVAGISSSVQNLWEFYQYEQRKLKYQMKNMIKDVYLEVWDDVKYIPYVDKKRVCSIFCSDVYNKDNLLLEEKLEKRE